MEIKSFKSGDVIRYHTDNESKLYMIFSRSVANETQYNLVSLKDGKLYAPYFWSYSKLLELLRSSSDYEVVSSKRFIDSKNYEHNPFQQYTDELATILFAKNEDYGDSFTKSMNKFGMVASVVRLEDKFNRLENLTTKHKQNVKDESLADTFLDLAGYAILSYKYLNEDKE